MKKHQINIAEVVGKGYKSFWHTTKRYRVLKGGRGSKKSITTALWYIYNIMKVKDANAVVVRKTGNTHKDSTFASLKWAAKRLKVYHLWEFKIHPMEAIYKPTGQKILFRGFDDPLKLTSLTVDTGYLCWAWIEEAYEIDDEQAFNTFDEGIRGKLPEHLYHQITLTFNPWVNSHWTKERFFDREDKNAFTLTTTHKCNEFLEDADHEKIEDLQYTDPERYKVVGLGEYGIPGGAYFDEFRRDIHVIDPIEIPDTWTRYIGMDYGLDMLAVLWFAVSPSNDIYVYRELHESNLIISDAAKRILEYNGKDKIKYTYAPPDMWNRRQDTGKSATEIYAENGVHFYKSSNNRIQGWYSVKELLKVNESRDEQTGEPIKTSKLKIFKGCKNLINFLPQIQRDEKNQNDCSTEPHNVTHICDALRYFSITRFKHMKETKVNDRIAYNAESLSNWNNYI